MLMSRHPGQPSVSPCLSKSLRERYMALRPLVLWPTRSASSGLSSGNASISASYSSTRRAPLSHEVHIRVLIGGVGVLTGLGPWLARIGCLDLKPPKYVSNTSNTLLDVTTRIGSHAATDISDDLAGWCLCGRDDVCGWCLWLRWWSLLLLVLAGQFYLARAHARARAHTRKQNRGHWRVRTHTRACVSGQGHTAAALVH